MIVRKLRLQRGWTQEQLAELTGLSVRSIQRTERGRQSSLETLNSLAAVFEVELSVIQPGEVSMSIESRPAADEIEAIEHVKAEKEFYQHVFMYLVFALVFSTAFGWRFPLIFWGLIGWGIGVVVHGLNVYEVINFLGPKWERKRIEQRLGRKL
jgi:transcriptional regulator with XRE-family HTH domain